MPSQIAATSNASDAGDIHWTNNGSHSLDNGLQIQSRTDRAANSRATSPDSHTQLTRLRTPKMGTTSSVNDADTTAISMCSKKASYRLVAPKDPCGVKSVTADNAEPDWRALKTKAGKDRRRLPLACIACRRKKTRCSGEQPSCKHCTANRLPCIYKAAGRKHKSHRGIHNDNVQPNTEEEAACAERVGRPKRKLTTTAIHGYSTSVSSDDAGLRHSTVTSDSLPTLCSKSTRNTGRLETALFSDGIEGLPSEEMQEHLFEVYFDRVDGQPYYLLHRQTTMRSLRKGTLSPVMVLSVCAVAARFSVNPKLLSTSAPFGRGADWATCAREICIKKYDEPDIDIVQSLVLLSLHEFGTGQHNRSWSISGHAIRMAFSLRLHEHFHHETTDQPLPELSFLDRQIQCRTMWACYLLDCFSAFDADQPTSINDESIDIPLPVNEVYFDLDMPSNSQYIDGTPYHEHESNMHDQITGPTDILGIGAVMVKAISIWSSATKQMRQQQRHCRGPISGHMAQLETILRKNDALLKNLPPRLRWSSENVEYHNHKGSISQYLLLHVCIPTTDVVIYNMVTSKTSSQDKGDITRHWHSEVVAHTLASAGRIAEVLQKGDRIQAVTFAPFAGYCALMSFSIQAMYLDSSNIQIKVIAEDNCAICLKYLHRLSRYWAKFQAVEEEMHQNFRKSLDTIRDGKLNPFLQDTKMVYQHLPKVFRETMADSTMAVDFDEANLSILEQTLEARSIDGLLNIALPGGQSPAVSRRATAEPALQEQSTISISPTSAHSQPYILSVGLPAQMNHMSTGRVEEVTHFGNEIPFAASQAPVMTTDAQQDFGILPMGSLPMLEIDNGGWHDDMSGDAFTLPADVSSWFPSYGISQAPQATEDLSTNDSHDISGRSRFHST